MFSTADSHKLYNYINRAVDEPATTARFGRNERSI